MKRPISQHAVALLALAAAASLVVGGAPAAGQSPGALLTPLPALTQPTVDAVRDLAFDRGGRHLYATSGSSYAGNPVYASLARDAGTGALGSRHTGTCVTTPGASGRSCRNPAEIVISADGHNAYVLGNYTYVSAVTTLTRSRKGVLAPTNRSIRNLGKAVSSLALSPDGRNVYVAVDSGVAVLDRHRDGTLTLPSGARRCYEDKEGCRPARGVVNAAGVAVSADGRSVYVALRQLAGPAGCVSSTDSGCTQARALRAVEAIALSADGRTLYTTARISQALAVLERDPATHGLAQPAAADGCANATGADGCMAVPTMTRPFAIAVSPDGRHVYVGTLRGKLLGFSRRL